MKETFYCPNCNGVRWKTRIKDKEYQCRKCGYIGFGLSKPKTPEVSEGVKLKWWQKLWDWFVNLLRKCK